jgi:hypothetical protein
MRLVRGTRAGSENATKDEKLAGERYSRQNLKVQRCQSLRAGGSTELEAGSDQFLALQRAFLFRY